METINIRTTQNVIINYDLAPLRDRLIGLLIDALLVIAAFFLVFTLVSSITEIGELLSAILPYLTILLFFVYTLSMEIFNKGQSLGKMTMGIRVLKLDGSDPSLSDYIIRSVFHLIDTYLCFGVLGSIFIATSENRQRMGDRAANTVVVKLNTTNMFNLNDILNISTIENYEPEYTEIKNISENDMLVVKNALLRHRNNPSTNNVSMIETLAAKMAKLLDVKEKPANNIEFLKTLIKDYIVLTR